MNHLKSKLGMTFIRRGGRVVLIVQGLLLAPAMRADDNAIPVSDPASHENAESTAAQEEGTPSQTTRDTTQSSPVAAPESLDGVENPSKEMVLMTVDKKTLTAELRTWPAESSHSKAIRSYRVAIGKQDGDKERSGDNKTPEGIYFALESFETAARNLPQEKFGPRAIPLNFPNPIDKAAGKTGHGIWLHGAGNDQRIETSKATEGCVAFYNSEVRTLERWLKPNQGVVVIARDVKDVNLENDVKAVRQATAEWAAAWDGRQLDNYISYYSPNFAYKNGKRDAYRNYKKSVFAGYHKMSVKFDNIRVITHPKYALSIMNQDFRGDNRFVSHGRKVLYWERVPGTQKWQITHEHHDSHKVELINIVGDSSQEPLQIQNASSKSTKTVPANF